jgi:hypothetical protein
MQDIEGYHAAPLKRDLRHTTGRTSPLRHDKLLGMESLLQDQPGKLQSSISGIVSFGSSFRNFSIAG